MRHIVTLTASVIALLLTTSPVHAKHPVRNVPIVVISLQPAHGQNTAESYARLIEFANRAYLNAGIQLTFSRTYDLVHLTDDELNCYDDDPYEDKESANWYADVELVDGKHTIISRRYHAIEQLVGGGPQTERVCYTNSCASEADCCQAGAFSNGECHSPGGSVIPLYGCHTAPDAAKYCSLDGYYSGGPRCFDASCNPTWCYESPDDPPLWRFILFRPVDGTDRIDALDHEMGHHLGLDHTFSSARCYDMGSTDVQDCTEPYSTCTNEFAFGGCPAGAPWRNIMSYHARCRQAYEGSFSATGNWNQSLSPAQIAIVWRVIDEYYDQPWGEVPSNPHNYLFGDYENFYLAGSTLHRRYVAQDSLGYVYNYDVGDSSWVKNHVKLYPGDFNGDGHLDVLAFTDGGSHPGLALYIAVNDAQGAISYSQVLVGPDQFSSARVAVGNIRGDWADDVLVTTTGGTYMFQGSATNFFYPMSYVGVKTAWTYPTVTPFVANLTGSWARTIPFVGAEHNVAEAQADVDSGIYGHIGYDDILIACPLYSLLFRGSTGFSLDQTDFWLNTTFTSDNVRFASNMVGDQHDDLAMYYSNNGVFRLYPGQDAFENSSPVFNYLGTAADMFTTGNFSGDYHSDFVWLRATSARLHLGGPSGITNTSWYRSDLNYSNTRFVAADFIRRGYDDVMISTPSGAFVYNGTKASNGYFHADTYSIWNPAYGYPAAEWFGR